MAIWRQAVGSRQYVPAEITATVAGASYNPTADPVQMGFGTGDAEPGTLHTALWDTGGPPYIAVCLVGPGGTVTLAKGTYGIWVKVTDSPEIPLLYAGQLVIY